MVPVYMVISLVQIAAADLVLGIASSESQLVVDLPALVPAPNRALYLHLVI